MSQVNVSADVILTLFLEDKTLNLYSKYFTPYLIILTSKMSFAAIGLTLTSNQLIAPQGAAHTYTVNFGTPGQNTVLGTIDPGVAASNLMFDKQPVLLLKLHRIQQP
jgi:hypothetical protein